MKVIIAIPSKSIFDPLLVEGIDYLKKLQKPWAITPLFISPHHSISEKEKRVTAESLSLLKKTEGFMRIALTEDGAHFSSLQFVRFLEKLIEQRTKVAFIIGGAFGLSQEAIKECDRTLSLSPMTLPHRMAFLVLCEQLYRAGEILKNTQYHK